MVVYVVMPVVFIVEVLLNSYFEAFLLLQVDFVQRGTARIESKGMAKLLLVSLLVAAAVRVVIVPARMMVVLVTVVAITVMVIFLVVAVAVMVLLVVMAVAVVVSLVVVAFAVVVALVIVVVVVAITVVMVLVVMVTAFMLFMGVMVVLTGTVIVLVGTMVVTVAAAAPMTMMVTVPCPVVMVVGALLSCMDMAALSRVQDFDLDKVKHKTDDGCSEHYRGVNLRWIEEPVSGFVEKSSSHNPN